MSSIDDGELDRSRYFVDPIQDHLLCPICSGVFTKPVVLSCCGQSLCENCLLKSMESCDKCPMCRREKQTTVSFVHNRVVDNQIQDMKVKCMNNKDPNACDCSWTGQVSEWENHVDNECEICEVSCPVAGCDFKGRRKDIMVHNSTNIIHHTNILVDAKVADLETKVDAKVADLETKVDAKVADLETKVNAKVADLVTKHENEIKDLNDKIYSDQIKILLVEKNHKNEMKKLRNEIIKKDAKTAALTRKHEQMDEQITDLEQKHTSNGVKLDRIELGMTALRKENRILKRMRITGNFASTSDNNSPTIINLTELNEWTLSILSLSVVKPSDSLLAYLGEHDRMQGNGSCLEHVIIPVLNRGVLRMQSALCSFISNVVSEDITTKLTVGRRDGQVYVNGQVDRNIQLCISVVGFYYHSLEAIMYDQMNRGTFDSLLQSGSFHRALLACCYTCVLKGVCLTQKLHMNKNYKSITVQILMDTIESNPFSFLNVVETLCRALIGNNESSNKQLGSPIVSGIPIILQTHIQKIESQLVDSLPRNSQSSTKKAEASLVSTIKTMKSLPGAWPPDILEPILPEEIINRESKSNSRCIPPSRKKSQYKIVFNEIKLGFRIRTNSLTGTTFVHKLRTYANPLIEKNDMIVGINGNDVTNADTCKSLTGFYTINDMILKLGRPLTITFKKPDVSSSTKTEQNTKKKTKVEGVKREQNVE